MNDHLLYSEIHNIIPSPRTQIIRISGRLPFKHQPPRWDRERYQYLRDIIQHMTKRERPIWHEFGNYSVLLKKTGGGVFSYWNLNPLLRNHELQTGFYKVRFYEVVDVEVITSSKD